MSSKNDIWKCDTCGHESLLPADTSPTPDRARCAFCGIRRGGVLERTFVESNAFRRGVNKAIEVIKRAEGHLSTSLLVALLKSIADVGEP